MAGLVISVGDKSDAAEVVSEVLNSLNPSEGGGSDWVLSDFSVDGALNAAFFGACKTLGFHSSENDFVQTGIIVISYSALAEFAQHVVGVGSGLGKLDFNGKQFYSIDH